MAETRAGGKPPERPSYSTPYARDGIKVVVEVDAQGIDEALEKARELIGVLEKIDGLTGRIVRDITKINEYALGRRI